jgi:hypothetical protein
VAGMRITSLQYAVFARMSLRYPGFLNSVDAGISMSVSVGVCAVALALSIACFTNLCFDRVNCDCASDER